MVDFRKLFEKEAEEDAALKNYVAQLPVYGVDPETGFTNYTNPVIPQLRLPVQGIHSQPYIPTQADLRGPVQLMPSVQQGIANVKDIYQHGFDTPENLSAKVFGPMEGGASDVPERTQAWPEKIVRSGTTLANDVMAGKVLSGPGLRAGDYSDIPGAPEPLANLIERTQDMAGLAAGGSIAATGLKAEKPGMLARGASNLKDRLHQFLAEENKPSFAEDMSTLAKRLNEHLNENAISNASITPIRSYKPNMTIDKIPSASNFNAPPKLKWSEPSSPGDYVFATNPQGKNLAGINVEWTGPVTAGGKEVNPGFYRYQPYIDAPIPGEVTTTIHKGPKFNSREIAQQYAEELIKNGKFDKEINTDFATPFLEKDMRKANANKLRSGFKLAEDDIAGTGVGAARNSEVLIAKRNGNPQVVNDTEVLKNPTENEFRRFVRSEKEVRTFLDTDGNTYAWSAKNGTHDGMAQSLNLTTKSNGPWAGDLWALDKGKIYNKNGNLIEGYPKWFDRLHEDDVVGTGVSSLADRLHEHLNERPNVSNEYKGETMPEILARQRASEGYEAAIRDPETKKLYTGMWHEEVLDKIAKDRGVPKAYLPDNLIKGYINDRGRFLTEEAVEKLSQNKARSKTAMFRSDDEAGTAIAGTENSFKTKNGETFKYVRSEFPDEPGRFKYDIKNEKGETIANFDMGVNNNKVMWAGVRDPYKRRGIATSMYDQIEKDIGKKIGDNWVKTPEGEAFWSSRNKFMSDDIVGTGLAAVAPRFHSHVENIAKAAPEKMTANEWKAYLKNKGATKEELEALRVHDLLGEDVERSGASAAQGTPAQDALNEWRKTNKGKPPDDLLKASRAEVEARVKAGTVKDESPVINREDLINHLNENKVELQEHWKGDKGTSLNQRDRARLAELQSELDDGTRLTAEETKDYNELIAKEKNTNLSRPRFAEYQLPGGNNYRELLLSTKDNPKNVKRVEEINNEIADIDKQLNKLKINPTQQALDNIANALGEKELVTIENAVTNSKIKELRERKYNLAAERLDLQQSFTHDHWPGQKDVVVHSRMNDRFIPDESGPAIKSVNNDTGEHWAYKSGSQDKDVKGYNTLHAEEVQSDWLQQGNSEGFKLSAKDKAKLEPEFNRIEEKITNSGDEQVMSNPEIKDAVKLAVDKKIITEAEAKTYLRYSDSERYGAVKDAPFKSTWSDLMIKRLIRQASEEGKDAISWTPGKAQADRYNLRKQVDKIEYMKNDDGTFELEIKGKNGENIPTGERYYTKETLKSLVGKEMADKIIKDEGKKSGNKSVLEGDDLEIGGEFHKKFYDEIMVNKVNAIAKKYGARVEEKEINYGGNKYGNQYGVQKGDDGRFHITTPEGRTGQSFATKDEALHEMTSLMQKKTTQKVWFLKLTPELKKAALDKGFSMFETGLPLTPVDHDPFERKKHRLVPVSHNPFQ